jgi:hypothetical protein
MCSFQGCLDIIDPIGRPQLATIISEPGLYKVLIRFFVPIEAGGGHHGPALSRAVSVAVFVAGHASGARVEARRLVRSNAGKHLFAGSHAAPGRTPHVSLGVRNRLAGWLPSQLLGQNLSTIRVIHWNTWEKAATSLSLQTR